MSQVHLVPTTMRVTAKEVVWLFLKEVMRLHGVPESIMLDHDTKFTSTFWRELHRLMGTKLLMSTVFHLQTDGTTERANHSIGPILRMIINDDLLEPWLSPTISFFVSVFLIWTLLLYAQTNLAYLLLCP